jgi:hypothetical protein
MQTHDVLVDFCRYDKIPEAGHFIKKRSSFSSLTQRSKRGRQHHMGTCVREKSYGKRGSKNQLRKLGVSLGSPDWPQI